MMKNKEKELKYICKIMIDMKVNFLMIKKMVRVVYILIMVQLMKQPFLGQMHLLHQ